MYSQTAIMYYSRPEIQQAILKFAKNREVGTYFNGFFGKRPDTIEYLSDIKNLVSKKIFSFHFSEERWANPLLLGNNLSEQDKKNNRIGWDLILDLDGVDFEYAKIVGKIIFDYLSEIGMRNISAKFSGNKGFHLAVPFEAFSSEIIGYGQTRELFPEAPRKIASFLMYQLRNKITNTILEKDKSVENISKKYNIPVQDLMIKRNGKYEFDYMKVIEVDTILISSRHLFRAPYSLHEKSSLASIPINPAKIYEFQKEEAKPENVNPEKYKNHEFLAYNPQYGKDADILFMKAYDTDIDIEDLGIDPYIISSIQKNVNVKNREAQGKMTIEGEFEYSTFDIQEEIERSEFPSTINYILENQFPDGKKRALFVLLTFLYSVNWQKNNIEALIEEWNSKQETPLKDNYITAQVSWFEAQQNKISTPSFTNENYYKSIGIPFETIQEDKNKYKETAKSPLHAIAIYLEYKQKNSDKKKKKKTEQSNTQPA